MFGQQKREERLRLIDDRRGGAVRERSMVGTLPRRFEGEMSSLFGAIRPHLRENRGVVFHFVAASAGEGTSTLAREFCCFAATAKQQSVLLVDGRGSEQADFFLGRAERAGLVGAARTDMDCLSLTQPVEGTNLAVASLVSGAGPEAGPFGVRKTYEQLRKGFDLVVVDCPPINSGHYSDLVPEATDGIVLVIQAEKTRPEILAHDKRLIEQVGARFIGAVLNKRKQYIPGFVYKLI
jgi:Mrp family chromosome partitioning ATPase